MTEVAPGRRVPPMWLAAGAAVSIALSIAFIDHPVAVISAKLFDDSFWMLAASALLDTTPALLALFSVFVVACGLAVLAGRELPPWTRPWLRAALATVVTLAIALLIKQAVGRPSVPPQVLPDGDYAFHPFAAGLNGGAFPSATMAMAAAFFSGRGFRSWRSRATAIVLLTALAASLVITNGHWIADILGGVYLGWLTGAATVAHARVAHRKFMAARR